MRSDDVVLILAYPGVSAFEAVGALATLRAAGVPAELVSVDALVHSHEGARLVPHRLGLATLPEAATVIVPGGDVSAPLKDAELARALRQRRGRWTIASGEAVRLAHAAGLAYERRVARRAGAEPIAGTDSRPARLVQDGRLLTCEGGDSLVDLVIHFVAQVRGHDAAARVAADLGREHRPFVLGARDEHE